MTVVRCNVGFKNISWQYFKAKCVKNFLHNNSTAWGQEQMVLKGWKLEVGNISLLIHYYCLFFKGSLVWFDGNVGYLLPGKLLSFVGQDVKVQHQEDGQVFFT